MSYNGVCLISGPQASAALFNRDKLFKRGGMERDEFQFMDFTNPTPIENVKCIVTLGIEAFREVLPEVASLHGVSLFDSKKTKGTIGYTFWSERFGTWVIPTVDPGKIFRGQTAWAQSFIFCVQRALEVARDGYSYETGDYTLDCSPMAAHKWVDEFEDYYRANPDLFLSCDIETPEKDADESELDLESNTDYIVLRCGYSYRDGHGLSIPWDGAYRTVHERLLTHPASKAWWNGCPTPDHKVLTADLKWKAAGDIKLGDTLVSFDEDRDDNRRLRRYKTGTVISNNRYIKQVFGIHLSDGSILKVTGEHPWLAKPQTGPRRRAIQWVKTSDLKVGDILPKLFEQWQQIDNRDLGYLAGFYDGEGSIAFEKETNTFEVSASQKTGLTLDKVIHLLKQYNFDPKVYPKYRVKEPDARSINLGGNNREQVRFLGLMRPDRLLNKFKVEHMGAVWGYEINERTVVKIEDLGQLEIVTLSLDTGTYILEGYGSHNSYDQPRIINQSIIINGTSHDGMDAWHILNSDLKKSLNFVTPWFRKRLKMWKHLSSSTPAFYNAVDADAAGSNLRGIIELLKRHDMYKVYQEFVLELDPVFSAMTRAGMPIDRKKRIESAKFLTNKRKDVLEKIDELVPEYIKPCQPKAGYKKVPKDTTGLTEVVFNGLLNKYCSHCGQLAPPKSHFKPKLVKSCSQCGGKWTASHSKTGKRKQNPCEGAEFSESETNPCIGASIVEKMEGEKRWARVLPFVPSQVGILKYQAYMKHPAITVGKGADKKATTNEKAIKKLMGKYPADKLYPTILEFRELQTLVTRYIGEYHCE